MTQALFSNRSYAYHRSMSLMVCAVALVQINKCKETDMRPRRPELISWL